MRDRDALEDPKATYNAKDPKQLQKLLPAISFKDYFASFTPRPHYPNPVIVTSPKYLEDLTTLLEGVDPQVLEGYFVFRTAQTVRLPLPSRTTVNFFTLMGTLTPGSAHDDSTARCSARGRRCARRSTG